jgi:hypothetical protein
MKTEFYRFIFVESRRGSIYLEQQLGKLIVIYATSFCVNWAFLIARGTRLKHERSEGLKRRP